MIVNRKTVDPADTSSPAVIQLETAMGAAIDVFEGAAGVRVPRSRFAPVKTTDDLLVAALGRLRADRRGARRAGARARRHGRRSSTSTPSTSSSLPDFEARFPAGPPSLVECERLTSRAT